MVMQQDATTSGAVATEKRGRGRPRKLVDGQSVGMYLERELLDLITGEAKRLNISTSDLLRLAVRKGLKSL